MRGPHIAMLALAGLGLFAAVAHRQATAGLAGAWPALDAPTFSSDEFAGLDPSEWPDTEINVAGPTPEDASAPDAPTPAPLWAALDLWGIAVTTVESNRVAAALAPGDPAGDNVRAFLAMIAASEGTARAADPYRVCYGYRHTIADLSDHPACTGEWRGESLDALGPRYVGKVSTAAGRYQVIKASWLEGKHALDLVDFGPASQDAWAVWKLRQRGALDAVRAGRVEDAIALCRREWASLPGAGYGQPENKLASLLTTYSDAGGLLA